MDSTSQIILLIILSILLIMSGFFSASETALMSLSKLKIRSMEENGVKGVDKLVKLTEDSSKLLTTILVGNNIVNIAATSIATTVFTMMLGSNGAVVATSVMTVLVLIFGEIVPKTIASNNPEKISLKVVNLLSVVLVVLAPLVWLFGKVKDLVFLVFRIKKEENQVTITEEELKTLVDVSHEEGILEVEEKDIIQKVFAFGEKQVKDAMVNRLDVSSVDVNSSYSELLSIFKDEKFTRMPVYEENIDNIVGVINLKDIVFLSDEEKSDFNIKAYMREPFYTYEYKSTSELLSDMKERKIQIAVVVDEYGATAGITTIENLIEEIVGDIEDEYDIEEKQINKISDSEYIIDGSVSILDVNEEIGLTLESVDFDSIGGYIIDNVKRFPKVGEELKIGEVTFIIEDADRVKINKVKVKLDMIAITE